MIWYICSAAGGTGKTRLACALAEEAAGRGKSPLLLDAAGSLQACVFRLRAEGTLICLSDVLQGDAELAEAVYDSPIQGVRLAVASFEGYPGVSEYAPVITELRSMADPVIVDTGTGEEGPSEELWQAGDRALVLSGPDECGLRQAAQRLFHLESAGACCDLIIDYAPADWRAQEKLATLAEEISGRKPLLFIHQESRADDRAIEKCFRKAAHALMDNDTD